MQGLPVILKLHNLQSLDKALDLFIEFEFCESDFYFLDRSKKCIVATNDFGSVYTNFQFYIVYVNTNMVGTRIVCPIYVVYLGGARSDLVA